MDQNVDQSTGSPEPRRDAPSDGTLDAAIQAEMEQMRTGEQPPEGSQEDDPQGDDADAQGNDEQDDQQDDQADDGQDPADDADAEFVTIEKDGKKYEIPKALQDELMFKADYTRKRQAETEFVKQVQAQAQQLPQMFEAAQHVQQERAALGYVETQRKALLEQTNWAEMEQLDHVEYARRTALLTHLDRQRGELNEAIAVKTRQLGEYMETQRMTQANNTAATLMRDHGWNRERHTVVQQYAHRTFGHNPVVMQALHDGVDPGIYLVLEKAAKFDQLQAAKPGALQKARAPAQRVQVRPGSGSQPTQRTGPSTQQATQRLTRTGSVNDAVALELSLMERKSSGRRR